MQTPASRRPPKRLLFDRRYGWVVDEWRDPSGEALAGGRGMFCILPIAKALANGASQLTDFIANSVVKAIEKKPLKPDSEIAHQVSKADYMNEHFQKVTLFDLAVQQNLFALQAENPSEAQAL